MFYYTQYERACRRMHRTPFIYLDGARCAHEYQARQAVDIITKKLSSYRLHNT